MSVEIYGASDDLIEIEGDIREEFSYHQDEDDTGDYLALSNGVILKISYGSKGVWRITPVDYGDIQAHEIRIVQAPENDENDYSDRAFIEGDISWVVQGIAYAKRLP